MINVSEGDLESQIPFIATRGYDSVVWNRLYSRDTTDLEDYHIEQASTIVVFYLKMGQNIKKIC